MKKDKKIVIMQKNTRYFAFVLFLCLFFVCVVMFLSNQIFAANPQNTNQLEDVVWYENENPINLDKIIAENTAQNIRKEMLVEEIDLEYTTQYKNNPDIPSGVMQVLQEGRSGRKKVIAVKEYKENELIAEEEVAQKITKAPVDRIVEIGSGSKYNRYQAEIGDTAYVVSASVAVRLQPDEASEKICTLNKDTAVQILQIVGDWYFISTVEIKGYVPGNCMTTKNPNQEEEKQTEYSKQKLLANLKFDMDLGKPSDLSLEQFKTVLSGNSFDQNHIFEENAEYFYYVEKQYKINGIFVASVGIHESAWGTSTIAKNKKNLFGYGAVDSNPYGGAYSFENYVEGIDLVSRVFVKYYLNPAGEKLYDGSQASGKFYSGSTLSAVNSRYASDKNWARGVYKWMEYLYGRL